MDHGVMHKLESDARAIGKTIDRAINPNGKREYGFCLMLFSFKGEELTYISNSERESMIAAVEEWLIRVKTGNVEEPGGLLRRN